MKVVKDFT